MEHLQIVAIGRKLMHARNAAEKARPKHKAMSRLQYIANCRASHRQWYRNNKEAAFALVHKRRAQEWGTGGHFTADDIYDLMARQRLRCAICDIVIGSKFHRDHIIPVSKGGSSHISNIQLLCAPCNMSKHDKI